LPCLFLKHLRVIAYDVFCVMNDYGGILKCYGGH